MLSVRCVFQLFACSVLLYAPTATLHLHTNAQLNADDATDIDLTHGGSINEFYPDQQDQPVFSVETQTQQQQAASIDDTAEDSDSGSASIDTAAMLHLPTYYSSIIPAPKSRDQTQFHKSVQFTEVSPSYVEDELRRIERNLKRLHGHNDRPSFLHALQKPVEFQLFNTPTPIHVDLAESKDIEVSLQYSVPIQSVFFFSLKRYSRQPKWVESSESNSPASPNSPSDRSEEILHLGHWDVSPANQRVQATIQVFLPLQQQDPLKHELLVRPGNYQLRITLAPLLLAYNAAAKREIKIPIVISDSQAQGTSRQYKQQYSPKHHHHPTKNSKHDKSTSQQPANNPATATRPLTQPINIPSARHPTIHSPLYSMQVDVSDYEAELNDDMHPLNSHRVEASLHQSFNQMLLSPEVSNDQHFSLTKQEFDLQHFARTKHKRNIIQAINIQTNKTPVNARERTGSLTKAFQSSNDSSHRTTTATTIQATSTQFDLATTNRHSTLDKATRPAQHNTQQRFQQPPTRAHPFTRQLKPNQPPTLTTAH